ncbi:hypothetical protein [Pectobacterium parmentieri]|uniref:hypothetical protein n=1 Tax=Pectobacterium parmentieri TaxID=1905730 RepID=UPI001E2DE4B9|nr:hypothetical protein [Pectobacterium parmentieri]
MIKTDYQGTTICVLDENDKLADCPEGSYAVIEDSGFYVVLLVMGTTPGPSVLIWYSRWKMRSTLLPSDEVCHSLPHVNKSKTKYLFSTKLLSKSKK